MTPAAFNRAWEERPRRFAASRAQHREVAELAGKAGIEKPRVFWSHDAVKAIERLERIVREPSLGPM